MTDFFARAREQQDAEERAVQEAHDLAHQRLTEQIDQYKKQHHLFFGPVEERFNAFAENVRKNGGIANVRDLAIGSNGQLRHYQLELKFAMTGVDLEDIHVRRYIVSASAQGGGLVIEAKSTVVGSATAANVGFAGPAPVQVDANFGAAIDEFLVGVARKVLTS